jgi:hypothetical protein
MKFAKELERDLVPGMPDLLSRVADPTNIRQNGA